MANILSFRNINEENNSLKNFSLTIIMCWNFRANAMNLISIEIFLRTIFWISNMEMKFPIPKKKNENSRIFSINIWQIEIKSIIETNTYFLWSYSLFFFWFLILIRSPLKFILMCLNKREVEYSFPLSNKNRWKKIYAINICNYYNRW